MHFILTVIYSGIISSFLIERLKSKKHWSDAINVDSADLTDNLKIVSIRVWITNRAGTFPTGLRMVSKSQKVTLDRLEVDAERPAEPLELRYGPVHVGDAGPVFVLILSYAPLGMVHVRVPRLLVTHYYVFDVDDWPRRNATGTVGVGLVVRAAPCLGVDVALDVLGNA